MNNSLGCVVCGCSAVCEVSGETRVVGLCVKHCHFSKAQINNVLYHRAEKGFIKTMFFGLGG